MNAEERRKAVLIVEDEPLVLMLAVAVVEDAGFEALMAANADEALDALAAEHEDIGIVFTDIHMPGSMNGLQLAFAIRKRWPPIEILIASGRDRPSKAELPPRSEFLAKPYGVDHLRDALRRMAA